jgi:membrane protease YdiL (CAAX protease family)
MNSLGLFLAAVAVAAIPMLWFEMEKHLSLLPEREWSFTASLLIVLPGTTGLVLISVPFTPEIEWARPDMFGIFLMLATSPVLWGLGILIGVFSHLIGFVIQVADINPWEKSETTDANTHTSPSPWLLIPVGSLVGGAEELLFRGIILIWLTDGFGILLGLLLNGILFGLYHYPNSVDSLREINGEAIREMSLSGAGGVILGAFYLYTDNLLVPLVGHALHNAGLFYVLYVRTNS